MRSTPHPLTIIVSHSPSSNRPDPARGLLVSSFNTLTLHPKPYVSFNIKTPSSTYAAICESGYFVASGLYSSRVADAFAKNERGTRTWQSFVQEDGKLQNEGGGTWWMRCRWTEDKCVKVGDHVIVVAEVVQAMEYRHGGVTGLVYAHGTYREVGEEVDIDEMGKMNLKEIDSDYLLRRRKPAEKLQDLAAGKAAKGDEPAR
ncbi:hypothetical protein MMC28_005601 [Mycoblastus sanguinarius]|nr:hypothetical protein [Mycoblastus sanguinarius]